VGKNFWLLSDHPLPFKFKAAAQQLCNETFHCSTFNQIHSDLIFYLLSHCFNTFGHSLAAFSEHQLIYHLVAAEIFPPHQSFHQRTSLHPAIQPSNHSSISQSVNQSVSQSVSQSITGDVLSTPGSTRTSGSALLIPCENQISATISGYLRSHPPRPSFRGRSLLKLRLSLPICIFQDHSSILTPNRRFYFNIVLLETSSVTHLL